MHAATATVPAVSFAADRCPLCGAANVCAEAVAQATGQPPETCWCRTATIDAATLARIPADARGKACICARCATTSDPISLF